MAYKFDAGLAPSANSKLSRSLQSLVRANPALNQTFGALHPTLTITKLMAVEIINEKNSGSGLTFNCALSMRDN